MERVLTTVAGGFLLPEGPRWHDGALWFVDMLRGNVHQLADGDLTRVASFDRPSALGFLPSGDMLVVDGNKSQVHTLHHHEVTETQNLSDISHHLNDMAVDSNGWAYIDVYQSDAFANGWQPDGQVVLVKPGAAPQIVAENIVGPNGIAISPDKTMLAVGESMGPGGAKSGARILGYTIAPDGTLSDERILGTIARGSADGLCFDADGAIWVGTSFGHEVQRFVEGDVTDRIVLPDRKWALACALGGPELRTLFICSTAPPPKGDVTAYTDAWIEAVEVEVPGFAA